MEKLLLLALLSQVNLLGQTQVDWISQVKNKPAYDARQYNFPPQSPGGNLSVGANTITMKPCPQGVSRTDLNHQLYISGGTGTPEAGLITGGTCTSGAASGTIILSLSNIHSGAWKIGSATNGLQEAEKVIKATGNGGLIQVAAGLYNQCGTFNADTPGIFIQGTGSAGTGLESNVGIVTGGGTTIQPCTANQVLFTVSQGYPYTSTVSFLSVRDIAFYNKGLVGIKAIYAVRDTTGLYQNLSFTGATNLFYGFYFDRTWGEQISHITTWGMTVNFFGSTVDVDTTWGNTLSGNLYISNWVSVTTNNVGSPIITLQRCITCTISNTTIFDPTISVTNTGVLILNDSEGTMIQNIFLGELSVGIGTEANTVGSTGSAPGETIIVNAQIDCAGGAGTGCANNSFIGIQFGASSYNNSVINATITSSSAGNSGAQAINVSGNSFTGLFMARIIGSTLSYVGANQIVVTGAVPTPTGLIVEGCTFLVESTGVGTGVLIAPSTTLSNFIFTGNYVVGSSTPIYVNTGSAIVNSYVTGNICTNDPNGTCNGAYGPTINRDTTPIAYASLPTCNGSIIGERAAVNNSNTSTWGASIAGGGTNVVQAWCNGSTWTVSGK